MATASVATDAPFLQALCHELRTPLASIRGYLEDLLEGESDPPRVRRCLETVQREALRLARMLDGAAEFSLFDPSPANSDAASCDITEQIESAVEVLAPLAARRCVRVRFEGSEPARVRAEADACMHVLLNLIDNAVTHGYENGNVRVSCERLGSFVEVVVDDDGPGFFGQPEHGHGLGLRISRAIAQRAGGEIRFGRSPLHGVRALFCLPASEAEAMPRAS